MRVAVIIGVSTHAPTTFRTAVPELIDLNAHQILVMTTVPLGIVYPEYAESEFIGQKGSLYMPYPVPHSSPRVDGQYLVQGINKRLR